MSRRDRIEPNGLTDGPDDPNLTGADVGPSDVDPFDVEPETETAVGEYGQPVAVEPEPEADA